MRSITITISPVPARGVTSTVLPVIAGGNTCVVLAGHEDPRTAVVNPNQFKDYGVHSRKTVASAMRWFDGQLADGRPFLAGPDYTMADIVLLCGIDFAKFVKMDMPEEAKNLHAWHARVSARPSAAA